MEMEYHVYRKTIEHVVVTEKDGVECLSDAWKVGKEMLGPPLIDPQDYPEDRTIRVRMKVIRGKADPDKE